MSIFAKAKASPIKKAPAAKKTKLEIQMPNLQSLAEVDALMKSLEAIKSTLEAEIKVAGFSEFVNMDSAAKPESFKGIDGYASCSVEMRKRATTSALNADEVALLEKLGLTPEKQIMTREMFGINPKYASDEELMNKVSAAIESFVPEDFIEMQEEKSKLVVNDEVMNAAFKLSDAEERKTAIKLCTVMALKPRLSNEYPMEDLVKNVLGMVTLETSSDEE